MRVVIQRVSSAKVCVDERQISTICKGLVVLVGIEQKDSLDDVHWLVGKISALRIFDDQNGVMNLSVKDLGLEILVISQFTLYASTKKGNRPSYMRSAEPAYANKLYRQFIEYLSQASSCIIGEGVFGANMQLSLTNDGPVTIIIDSCSRE